MLKRAEVQFGIEFVSLQVLEYSDYVYLEVILVDSDHRNVGIGSYALKEVIDFAKIVKKPLLAFVTDELGSNQEQLEKWYIKHGFYKEQYEINSEFKYNYRIDF